MTMPLRAGLAFLLATLIGALSGILLILLWGGEGLNDPPFLLMVLFFGTLFSLPYVATGLLLFAVPFTWLLRFYVARPWFGLLAAAWGGVAGSIIYYWYNQIHYDGVNEMAEFTGIQELGPVYGIPTGLAWWLLCRRLLTDREAA